ncbi:MAG: histidine phosphatase family protein [Candidatus Aenigmarchaeota archaeon]|nr:histidine phosphatase family protein [Candidatus Aenigmarchaeota archaeon]
MEKLKLKWPSSLVVIRHGQSEQNVALDLLEDNLEELLEQQKRIRDADAQLTPIGLWQAQQTGLHLAHYEAFDICFSSPYRRTLQTSEEVISNLGYDLRIFKENRLREKEFGRLHGFKTDEIKDLYPEEFEDRKRDGKYWYRLPRGENYPDVEDRVHSFLDKLARDYGGKNVLVVTHQVPYKIFRALFEHLDEESVLALEDTPNCGIQEYRIDTSKAEEGRLKLVKFNEVAYKD